MLEGARSAEPPMNSGSTLAMAFKQSCHSNFTTFSLQSEGVAFNYDNLPRILGFC